MSWRKIIIAILSIIVRVHGFTTRNIIINSTILTELLTRIHLTPTSQKLMWAKNNISGDTMTLIFDQYLRYTDSLQRVKRLDVLFTGTSHSPFIVSDPEYYNKRFKQDLEKITNIEDIKHFENINDSIWHSTM